jgi:hypothetical protein
MRISQRSVVLGVALALALPAIDARAHWCDDMWISAYNISIRPDSDTSPKALYVQNSMGYQLPSFKLTATSSSGGAISLTAPTTLKLANTLLPGEKGIWKIASGNPAKIEDLTFSVSFGTVSGQNKCYPLVGAKAVQVVKNDGTLYPATPAGLDNPNASANGCTAIIGCGRVLIDQAIADFEDLNVGLDKLLQLFCSGRGSWGYADAVSPAYCKDTSSTTCPTSKMSAVGSVSDYAHLWAAGELAIRKASLGARLAVLRERLKCAVNDGDMGFAGYPLFVLGYLGDDSGAKSFLQTKVSAGGDLGTIAKAALYLTGDTAQKADVQAGVKSSSVFVKVACAAALAIVDKDDASVTSAIIPSINFNEPSTSSEDGKGMYAVHILEIVAFDRRGWVAKGVGDGPVTFYGETGGGAGGRSGAAGSSGTGGGGGAGGTVPGTVGTGGTTGPVGAGGASGGGGAAGNRDGGVDAPSLRGGSVGSGGRTGSGGVVEGAGGSPGSGGSPGVGGSVAGSGRGGGSSESATGHGGSAGLGGTPGSAGGSSDHGSSAAVEGGTGSDCKCSLGRRPNLPVALLPTVAGLACLLIRRRRRWHY